MKLCARCKKRPVEQIDDWTSLQCIGCNDRDVENYQDRREFEYYHPPLEDHEKVK